MIVFATDLMTVFATDLCHVNGSRQLVLSEAGSFLTGSDDSLVRARKD